MFHENTMLQTENDKLRARVKALQETIDGLKARNSQILAERAVSNINNLEGELFMPPRITCTRNVLT